MKKGSRLHHVFQQSSCNADCTDLLPQEKKRRESYSQAPKDDYETCSQEGSCVLSQEESPIHDQAAAEDHAMAFSQLSSPDLLCDSSPSASACPMATRSLASEGSTLSPACSQGGKAVGDFFNSLGVHVEPEYQEALYDDMLQDLFKTERVHLATKIANTAKQMQIYHAISAGIYRHCTTVYGWMLEITEEKRARSAKVLHCAADYFERYLTAGLPNVLDKSLYQLVATACLLISFKREEREEDIPSIADLNDYAANQYTPQQIRDMEEMVLNRLEFDLESVTPVHFMDFFELKAITQEEQSTLTLKQQLYLKDHCNLFCDLGLQNRRAISHVYPPSVIAASALLAARTLSKFTIPWPKHLEQITTYAQEDLQACAAFFLSCSQPKKELQTTIPRPAHKSN